MQVRVSTQLIDSTHGKVIVRLMDGTPYTEVTVVNDDVKTYNQIRYFFTVDASSCCVYFATTIQINGRPQDSAGALICRGPEVIFELR